MSWSTAASLRRRPLLLGGVGVALAGALGCDASAAKTLFPTRQGVMSLAADETHLCWVTGPEHGKLFVARRDDGPALPRQHNLDWTRGLALVGGHAYLALGHGVVRAPIDGGPTQEIAGRGQAVQHLVVTPSGLFWLERSTGALWRSSHEGAESRRLVTGPRSTTGMTADDGYVYWTAGESGRLLRVSQSGGTTDVLHRADHPLTDLVGDGRRLYWCTPTTVMAMTTSGGEPEVIAARQVMPGALAVSAAALCWVNGRRGGPSGSGDVMARLHGASTAARAVGRGAIVQALAVIDRALYWADQGRRSIMGATLET